MDESGNSLIFRPHRTIGIFCNGSGFCVENFGCNSFLTTSIGPTFQTYNCKKLNLVCVSDKLECDISLIAATGTGYLVCAHENSASVWKRGKMVGDRMEHANNIVNLLCVGEKVLSLDSSGCLIIWEALTKHIYSENYFTDSYQITAWCHPPTYINKVVFGMSSGAIQIWNMRTCKTVFTIDRFQNPISCLKESPALDIIAIATGHLLVLYNIKTNTELFSFESDINAISHISFQTDGNVNSVAFCGGNTDIMVLDLDHRSLTCAVNAHSGRISGIAFLPGRPILVTAGADNKIGMWVFDLPDGSGRLLKSRSGHFAPISKLRFFGQSGLNLISSSGNSLRFTNCNRDEQSFAFSAGKKVKGWKHGRPVSRPPLPDIIEFSACSSKQGFWENCVSCHKSSLWVHTWDIALKKIGKKRLKAPRSPFQCPISLAISVCGNHCLVGYSRGGLERFNLESGQHRGSFCDEPPCTTPVRGVIIDGRNRLCCSIDATHCRIWNFHTLKIKARIRLSSSPSRVEINRDSSLIAIMASDALFVIDLDTYATIRQFSAPNPAFFVDLCISQDARWLLAARNDCCVCVWDLPSARLIDTFTTAKPVSSLSLSFNQDMLALSFLNDLDIDLFSNTTLYSESIITPLPSKPLKTQPSASPFPDAIFNKLATLSLLPQSRWRHLDKIDLIKNRSKLEMPLPKLESAPFFIPTITGLTPAFDVPDSEPSKPASKLSKTHTSSLLSTALSEYTCAKDKSVVFKALLALSPNEQDIQLRCLSPPALEYSPKINLFLDVLTELIGDFTQFEFMEGVLALFLSIHGETLMLPQYSQPLKKLRNLVAEKWGALNESTYQSLSVLGFLRSSVTQF